MADRLKKINPRLEEYISEIKRDVRNIPEGRRVLLDVLSNYIRERGEVQLIFICTHNSRRSHMSQIWAQVAASYYQVSGVQTYSGGTEATSFNPRAVEAMKRAGFQIEGNSGSNPKYQISYGPQFETMIAWSKKYDDPQNPASDFAAVMTCSDADEACPIVVGADARIPLFYEDPKDFDGTLQEEEKYDERCRQIATEMLYVMSKANA